MNCFNIKTEDYPVSMLISVSAKTPVDLILKGYDTEKVDSIYFQREVSFFTGTNEFDIPMPLTPKSLKLCVYGEGVSVNYVKAKSLIQKAPAFYEKRDQEYFDFIFEFCKKAGYLPPGIYYSENGNFEIKISKKIYNEDGSPSSTPARIFHDYGEIEVSQEKFKKMTVFMRILILLHEYFHVRLPRLKDPIKEEEKADLAALEVYRSFNFPKTEALNSFIKVFRPVNEAHERALIERTDKLFNFLKFN